MTMSIEEKKSGVPGNEISGKSTSPVTAVKVEGKKADGKSVEVGEYNAEVGRDLDLEPYRGDTQFYDGETDPSEIVNRQPGRAYRRVYMKRVERENNDRGWQPVQGKDPERFVNSSSRRITPRPNDASDTMQRQGDLTLCWKPKELHDRTLENDRKRARSSIRDAKDAKEKLEQHLSRLGIDPSIASVKEAVVSMSYQKVSRHR